MKIKANLALSESGFMFDPETGDSYSLNTTGKDIINQIKQGIAVEEIRKNLLKKYDVDNDTFEMNFYDFIGMLKLHNIIEQDGEN